MKITVAEIETTLQAYSSTNIADLADKICVYIDLLLKWNQTISLTTINDPLEIVKFHFGESLFAANEMKMSESRLADVGTGAGFPGLPLAMRIPQTEAILIESNTKKCAFLREAIRSLELNNAKVFQGRMEAVSSNYGRFDFITARALGQLESLLKWARGRLITHGELLLWLGEADSAEIATQRAWRWRPPILIPGSRRRYLLKGTLV
jgi:16S rRNA (guanine527-N7)-methyltransferase